MTVTKTNIGYMKIVKLSYNKVLGNMTFRIKMTVRKIFKRVMNKNTSGIFYKRKVGVLVDAFEVINDIIKDVFVNIIRAVGPALVSRVIVY